MLLLAVMVAVDVMLGRQINGAYGGAAVLTAIYADQRRTAVVCALTLVMSAASGLWNDNLGERDWAIRFATCALICGLALVAAHVNRRRQQRLESTTALAQRVLDSLAVELTGARTVKEVADGFVGNAMGTMGASSAMVLALDADDVLRTLTWHGRTGAGADQYQEIPLSSDLPGAVAVREGRDIHFRSLEEIVAAFPALATYYRTDRSLHLLPLQRDGRRHGLLAITFPPGLFTPHEDGFLRSLAGALTSAVERAAELQRSDAATQRTVLLAEVSMSLSRSLDMDTTVAECARILVPRFADWYSLQLLRDGQLETVSVTHRDPQTTQWARSLLDAFPTRMDAATGAAQVVRSGRSELYPFIPADLIEAAAASPEHLEILRRLYEVVRGPESVRLLVGDVRGKGLTAVRTATVVLGEFRAAAAGTGDVALVAREIDRRILPYLPDSEDFVTALLVDIRHDGSFDVVSCGHPAPVLLDAGGRITPVELDHEPPLGLGVDPVPAHGTLAAGDRMLLFTDGLIEARSPQGTFIDPAPLLAAMGRADLDSALDELLLSLTREAGHALDDDLALLLACYDPDEAADSAPAPLD